MALATGTKLGPYEITGALGAGGMGEVYRARDTRLGRDVAIKILPEAFARDAERMARLRREAQVLASLNHPNIAAVYGFEDSGATHALVMELVEGPTLAERIKAGAIPVDEALPVGKQICEGLEYAHERGIIHRDLKPSNIKISSDDAVKILDFGLAKAIEGDASATSVENSPTLSAVATRAGFLLGTAAYMSPEQARGKNADRRSDIWAFGVVLFEMLSGKRLFAGETTSDTLAEVLKMEPDWTQLPANTPPRICELLLRCLKKDPRQRLQSIGDARIVIEEAISGTAASISSERAISPAPRWLSVLPWALTGLLAVALAAALLIFPLAKREIPASAIVSQIDPPPNTTFATQGQFGSIHSGVPALSPDGKYLAFVAVGVDGVLRLWVRPLDSPAARVLENTDGASYLFWSPDSRALGFFADGKLKTIDLSGGSPLTLADAPSPLGASWGADGTILFGATLPGAIFRVSASGGAPQQVMQLSQSRKDFAHRWPQFLPDGKHFLFFIWAANSKDSAVWAGSLDGGEPKLVLHNDSTAVYAPSGYLLFVHQGVLMAQRFDASKLQLSGEMEPVVKDVSFATYQLAPFTVSENSVLAYSPGAGILPSLRLLWFDRSGKQIGQTGTTAYYETPRISPQGDKLAVSVGDAQSGPGQIWVYDLLDGLKRRITFSGFFDVAPAWSADGKTLAFPSSRGGTPVHLYQKPSDGTGTTAPLFTDKALEESARAAEWTSDGRYLLFGVLRGIFAMPLFGDRKPVPVLQNLNLQRSQPEVSPDGRWIAYVGNGGEVDVSPFPHGGGIWQVSTNGASNLTGGGPRWRRDGKELFFQAPDDQIMAAEVSGEGGTFTVGKVVPLFRANGAWDVAPDGKKFVVETPEKPKNTSQSLTLVTNWTALLKNADK
jgi:eukaryotic-like serine/threonine-protein kinase